jgi:sugar/nucleoside kinase (ribokinase family)
MTLQNSPILASQVQVQVLIGTGFDTRRPGVPPPLLVSCVGHDAAGGALTADLAARGLPLRGVLRPPGAATATVSIIFDSSGEVYIFAWHAAAVY